MIQLWGRSQTLSSLSFPFFPLPLQTKEKNRKERALEEDEEKWRSMDSRENGNPFFHCVTGLVYNPSPMCGSLLRLLVFVVSHPDTTVQHCPITVWPAIYYRDKRHIVNQVLNFPFTHFLLLYWCWTGLCLVWMRLGLNRILGKIRYSLSDWHTCRSVV